MFDTMTSWSGTTEVFYLLLDFLDKAQEGKTAVSFNMEKAKETLSYCFNLFSKQP